MTFTWHSLGRACDLVRAAAVEAAIAPRDIDDLLIAVSEIVINAIRYAGGSGTITAQLRGDSLLVEISDNGPGLSCASTVYRPSAAASEGHGLRLARMLSKNIAIASGPGGVTVRILTPPSRPIRQPNGQDFSDEAAVPRQRGVPGRVGARVER